MDTRTSTSQSKQSYPSQILNTSTATTSATYSKSTTVIAATERAQEAPPVAQTVSFPSHLELLPLWIPQQSNIYHAQLLHYNKLISPTRGGGLQTQPLLPIVSSSPVQAAPRSRTSSRTSLKEHTPGKSTTSSGNASRSSHNSEKNRLVITSKDAPAKMLTRQAAEPKNWAQRAAGLSTSPQAQSHSNSVPSTPHHHARQFSFESRDPSPNAGTSHSPRSAYSETNSTLPSLRPLPPRLGGCKYETAQINSRRRVPYSVGSDRLEKLDLRSVPLKLGEEEEEQLAKDMRELYNQLLPTEKVEQNRRRLVDKLEKMFNEEWPGRDIKVHLFGSSGNLLCSDSSDVDICITTPWRELEGVCIIADLLARQGMENVVCISAAKVPIVKIWDPELGLACDMNVNNTLALENTRMVRTYVEADPRVRQLAMIIKYWTRRRIVNDAAFGGTLSSYTWICLIIAFLQLRSPAVLPALHQLPFKVQKPDGSTSEFADNMKKIKGYGNKNKSSVADLLFQFFRFYAHEYDYDKHVLSVRLGQILTKADKKWNYVVNNQLCVEEPFNTSRNLGNTADEYSFRGLHLELRRAFDLISQGKLAEACEQFVFPKEEGRAWPPRRASQPRPVLLQSSSQSHSGRGGRGNHRGNRHNNNNPRGGGSNRRASAGVPAYDNSVLIAPVNMAQDLSWYQNPQYQFPYTQQDLATQMAYHQESVRQHLLYANSPAFMQHQSMNQQQRIPGSASSVQPSSDRSRTNSFDTAPTSAPLRPEIYAMYSMGLGHAFYQPAVQGYGTYPSSPVTPSHSTQGFRRSLQRSVTADAGTASSSSLRSQSQPASRSPAQATPQLPASHSMTGPGVASPSLYMPKNTHGVPIPSFISDDADLDETPKAIAESPTSDDVQPGGFFIPRSLNPSQLRTGQQTAGPGVIAFGDMASADSGQHQPCSEQPPRTLLERRLRRASRSPSPLAHARAHSTDVSSAPLPASPSTGNQDKDHSKPLVVNGSSGKAASYNTAPFVPNNEYAASAATLGFENALQIQPAVNAIPMGQYPLTAGHMSGMVPGMPQDYLPVVGGGLARVSTLPSVDDTSFRERSFVHPYYPGPAGLPQDARLNAFGMMANATTGSKPSSAGRQRVSSRNISSGLIAPLDLAIGDNRINKASMFDMAHLSPVYETRTPSPLAHRKLGHGSTTQEMPLRPAAKNVGGTEGKKPSTADKTATMQDNHKPKNQKLNTTTQRPNAPRLNGHVRSAKSESDGGWQKAGRKKKAPNGWNLNNNNVNEQPPKNDLERKGG